MSRNIKITYDLKVPEGTSAPALDNPQTLQFPVAESADIKVYYSGLRESIERAKNTVGEELTAWRDAVGNREQSKEMKLAKKDEEEGDEDDDENEDEA
ncbi:uncharacterized protein PHACADRAFT_248656 [Phanerochaete carnosa HHB-10118-sp]|uniref:EKC/KEOPS complex subunit GON7 n=1 Tax=Phanerochaete carnosa (strain HHB-10118-sp) TaxID=650164 RepID=K5WQS0_PHACS|nr:uncharacterized protein PHACADRAFT_248656 [Phanerochaete carnosa HHB-10118-sp]EKM61790.1 hypothetical protein PHACADRAFT_248656 [Phanerochaete carnosa HHB-10118-sp]